METPAGLAALGYGNDPCLAMALDFVLSQQDPQGRRKLGNSLNGDMWADIEAKKKPSKGVTLRVLRLLKRVR